MHLTRDGFEKSFKCLQAEYSAEKMAERAKLPNLTNKRITNKCPQIPVLQVG